MFTAQPLSRQYWTWAVICSSVRSGRKEKQPCVTFIANVLLLSDRRRCGRNEVRRVRRFVVERHVLPDFQRITQRRAGERRLGEDLRTFVDVVAPLISGEDHRFERDAVGGGAGLDSLAMTDGAVAE